MIDQNFLVDIIKTLLPNRRRSAKGWETFNCVMCHHNGEPSPDKTRRGALAFSGPAFTYKCWRCRFKAHWHPGMMLSKKLQHLLTVLGVDDQTLNDIRTKILEVRDTTDYVVEKPLIKQTQFRKIKLPEGSKNLFDEVALENKDNRWMDVAHYILTRGNRIANATDYYWCDKTKHEMDKRFIIPFYYDGDLVGWTARYIGRPPQDVSKFRSYLQNGFLFNNQYLFDPNRKFVVLVEGPLDALAINGVAYLANEPNQAQINWLQQTEKTIILLADRERSGKFAIYKAIENGWHVAFPDWEKGIKDADEAAKKYGAIWTVRSILESTVKGESMIRHRMRLWL